MNRRNFFRNIASTIAAVAVLQGIVRARFKHIVNPEWETAPVELGIASRSPFYMIEYPITPYLRGGTQEEYMEPLFDQRYRDEGYIQIRFTADLKPVEPFLLVPT